MPSTVRLHRVLTTSPDKDLSRLPRGGCAGEMASAERLYLHRASSGAEGRRHLQNVVPEFHDGQRPRLRRRISGARPRRTPPLHGQIRRSEPARRDRGDRDAEESLGRHRARRHAGRHSRRRSRRRPAISAGRNRCAIWRGSSSRRSSSNEWDDVRSAGGYAPAFGLSPPSAVQRSGSGLCPISARP